MSQRSRLHWYQWEGVYTVDFTLDGVRRRCHHLGETLVARKWSCLITHDTRFIAGQFARYVYQLLQAQGVQVSFCPSPAPIPTVELALEQKRADCALIVSASNRPHWYNGLIVLAPPSDLALFENSELWPAEGIPLSFPPPPLDGTEQTQVDLRTPYFDVLRATIDIELIRRSSLTVFVDPMNGCTSGYIPALIREGAQTKAIEINRETDPLFGRQVPHPFEASLTRLRKLVKESDSHLGVALSADGRAIGVIDNLGDLVPPLEVALLLAQYLVRQYRQKGTVIVPLRADEGTGMRNWEQAIGLKVETAADPAARIAELVSQDRNQLLAGTTATGELTLSRYNASPDAIFVAMLLIEMIARSGGKLRVLVDALRSKMAGQ